MPISIEVGAGVPDLAWRDRLPPFSRRTTKSVRSSRTYRLSKHGHGFTFRVDDQPSEERLSRRGLQDAIEGDLALHVAASAPGRVFIHAGVVGWRGRALLLPGRTMTGKSSLVAALVAAGARYYSDEYAVLHANGTVSPYPRRMSLRRKAGLPRRVLPKTLGRRPLPVGWIVGSRYEAGREALEIVEMTAGRAALLLLDNAVAARLAPARVLPSVRAAAADAIGLQIVRGDAKRCAARLLADCQKKHRMLRGRRRSEGGK